MRIGKVLECGNCGLSFKTWAGYEDQDQDKGFGRCEGCQNDLEEKSYGLMNQVIEAMRKAMTKENLVKFDELSDRRQQQIAHWAVEKKLITWKIGI